MFFRIIPFSVGFQSVLRAPPSGFQTIWYVFDNFQVDSERKTLFSIVLENDTIYYEIWNYGGGQTAAFFVFGFFGLLAG